MTEDQLMHAWDHPDAAEVALTTADAPTNERIADLAAGIGKLVCVCAALLRLAARRGVNV